MMLRIHWRIRRCNLSRTSSSQGCGWRYRWRRMSGRDCRRWPVGGILSCYCVYCCRGDCLRLGGQLTVCSSPRLLGLGRYVCRHRCGAGGLAGCTSGVSRGCVSGASMIAHALAIRALFVLLVCGLGSLPGAVWSSIPRCVGLVPRTK